MKDIIENVIIKYKNGLRENHDAISISDKGVYTGSIKIKDYEDQEFVNHGFIPMDQIDEIFYINENGKSIKLI
jgi:hypothetical protein